MTASYPETDASEAVRRANRQTEKIPNVVLGGQPIGKCSACGSRFDYGRGTDTIGLDPCPECGSRDWHKWGYRYAGDEIPSSQIGDDQERDGQ